MGTDIIQQEYVENAPNTIGKVQDKGKVGEELLDPDIYDDHGDPHRAAQDPDADGKTTPMTWAAVFFLGVTFMSSLNFTLNTFVPVATTVAMELQHSTANVNWIAGGWSLGGSVAFAIAGQLSDLMGRKQVVLTGQGFLLVGHIVGASAQSFSQVIAAMTILGVGTCITFV